MRVTARRTGAWVVSRLASGRLAVALLAVLVLLLGLYLVVPQEDAADPEVARRWIASSGVIGELCRAIGLTRIKRSWLFYGAHALLFVNLALCMLRRLPIVRASCRLPAHPPVPAAFGLCRKVSAADLGVEEVAAVLARRGYRCMTGRDTVYGLRGRLALVGGWVFHVSFLVLLVAGALIAAAPSPFRATIGVGEGETFDLHTASFLGANQPLPPDFPGLRFQMESIDVVTEGTDVRRFDATVSTAGGNRATIGINRPYRERPYQVLAHGLGYMPGWAIVDERDRVRKAAWVKLIPFPLEQEDSFSLGVEDSTVHVRFHPDHVRQGGQDSSLSHELRTPRFAARVMWRGEQVYAGLLAPEQRVSLEDGKAFFFLPEIRRYALLDVMHDEGHTGVFASLGIMIVGLAIRYGRPRKEILVELRGSALVVYGASEILENLFAEELDGLVAELAGTHRGPADRRGIA